MLYKSVFQTVQIYSDPFDCKTDPCHLAWLLRDNRNYLDYIDGAACFNGTTFDQLIPNGIKNCPK